jgi:hypothetical protein
MWIKTTQVGGSYLINRGYTIFGTSIDGRLGYEEYAGGWHGAIANTPINDGEWHYVCMVRDASTYVSFYVDGQLDNTPTATDCVPWTSDASHTVFGSRGWCGDGMFEGSMDEIKIYIDRALTATEIFQSYFVPVTINAPRIIKIRSSGTWINIPSGSIPVTIFSTSYFDTVAMVDQSSLTFGATGDEHSLDFCSIQDVNLDGAADLVCHCDASLTGFERDDTIGILKGQTIDGTPIEGSDSVNIR